MADLEIRPVLDLWTRMTCAHVCNVAIQKHLDDRRAMLSALVIANSTVPIFAIIEGREPLAVAVCGLDLPGYARRLRFAWAHPDMRRHGIGPAIVEHVSNSAKHVCTAVERPALARLARRAGFAHRRKVPRTTDILCGTTREALSMPFAHPAFNPETIKRALTAFGVIGAEGCRS